MMRWLAVLLALCALLASGATGVAQETVFRVEYHGDPCQEAAAYGKDKQASVGGVTVSLETFYYAACERVREQVVDSVTARLKRLRSDLEGEALNRARPIYDGFVTWLSLELYDRLTDADKARLKPEEHFQEWLKNPDQELSTYVNYYFKTRMPQVAAALDYYQNDSSREIVSGLQALWQNAKKRLEDLDKAYEDIQDNPDTPYADILRKHGLSGEWIDRLQRYEGEFNLLDSRYNIVDTARTIHGAFTAETYAGRLEGMFSLMEKFGGHLSASRVPGVSLLGTLIEAYGQLAKEALARANELKKLIRAREGFCIGLATHTLRDERSQALAALAGAGTQACPLDEKDPLLRDIYVQTEPDNANQLYFWHNGGFIKGLESGGGAAGLRLARDFIRAAAAIGFAGFIGKDGDMEIIVAVYNTEYGPSDYLPALPRHRYQPGLTGLRAEGERVMDAIAEQVRALQEHARLDSACGERDFADLIRQESGLRIDAFPMEDAAALAKLKVSYVLGYIQLRGRQAGSLPERTAAYQTYGKVWRGLKDLSMVIIDGQVRDKNRSGAPCPDCAGADIDVRVSAGQEMAQCRADRSDAAGRFVTRIVTRSPQISIALSARAGATASEVITVDARHLGLDGVAAPFRRSFAVNLFLPVAADKDKLDGALAALRGLHGQAREAAGRGRAACTGGRQAIADIKAGAQALKGRADDLERQIGEMEAAAQQFNRAAARLDDVMGAAKRAAEAVADARQKGESEAETACDKAADIRKVNEAAVKNRLLRAVDTAAGAARSHAATAAQELANARRAAASAEETARSAQPFVEQLSRIRSEVAAFAAAFGETDQQIARVGDQLAALRTASDTLAAITAKAEASAAAVRGLAGSSPDEAATLARTEADRLIGEITAFAADLASCRGELEAEADKVRGLLDEAGALRQAYLDRTRTPGGIEDPGGMAELLEAQARDARASADVAEIFAEAAQAAAQNAETCRKLAASALSEDRSDDLAVAIEAALGRCEFEKARDGLNAMPGGARRGALVERYRALVERERATKARYEEAQALYKAGKIDAALAKLRAARAQSRCDTYRDVIDAAIARIEGGAGDRLLADARRAIGACDFNTAQGLIAKLGERGHGELAGLRADYDAAYQREARTNALWQQARALNEAGKRADAAAMLKQALANTRCDTYRQRIDSALAALDTGGAREPGASQVPSDGAATGQWAQGWRGTLRLTRLIVNGQSMTVASAIQRIDREWKRAKASASRVMRNGKSEKVVKVFGDEIGEVIGDILVSIVKTQLAVLNDGIPVSFVLQPQGDGYRPTMAGNGKAAAKANENMAKVPPFMPVDEQRLRMTHTLAGGAARIAVDLVRGADWRTATLSIAVQARAPAKEDTWLSIRSVALSLEGSLEPGLIPAEQLEARIKAQFEAAQKRYAR